MSLEEARDKIENLCLLLLSYANGGFIPPLLIQGSDCSSRQNQETSNNDTSEISDIIWSFIKTNYRLSPIESCGNSWFTETSDLEKYLGCFNSLERMVSSSAWEETMYFVLIHYFQAIHAVDWQVKASSIGSALERLSYMILVEDEPIPQRRQDHELLFDMRRQKQARVRWNLGRGAGQENISITGKRLRLTLERIGLTVNRNHNDINDVQDFLSVRNDSVHPRVGNMTFNDRLKAIMNGLQWLDEILLWRLGYDGH